MSRRHRVPRRAATRTQFMALLHELDVRPHEPPQFVLVSRWAAKDVWRIDVAGWPWAYIRTLIGPAERYPDRWRHMRLATLLHEARIGPRVLGLSPASEALKGRAVIIEAALDPLAQEALEARAVEAIALFTRLHSNQALLTELGAALTESERSRLQPLATLFTEAHERWFSAVAARWMEAGLREIDDLLPVVARLLDVLEERRSRAQEVDLIVAAHNDPNAGNFKLNRGGALRMIDFEDMELNNPVADLGIFLTWFADPDQHPRLLSHYPLVEPDILLAQIAIWVPLRYVTIAAHWAARLTRATDVEGWEFAAGSIEEWLHSAAEMLYGGEVPVGIASDLHDARTSLIERQYRPGGLPLASQKPSR